MRGNLRSFQNLENSLSPKTEGTQKTEKTRDPVGEKKPETLPLSDFLTLGVRPDRFYHLTKFTLEFPHIQDFPLLFQ